MALLCAAINRRPVWMLAIVALCVLAAPRPIATAQEPHYCGAFADGTYFAGARLTEWHDTNSQPKINGAWLFDPNRPVRWLRNESLESPVTPKACVELFGGDRLPGRVLEYSSGNPATLDHEPPHLVVRPDFSIDPPNAPVREQVRVSLPAIRRVIWQRRTSDSYTPGTLYYLDGRETPFRSCRWTSSAVLLLLKEGTRKVPFAEIAELHLPQRNPWEVYYETLAALTPDCAARLMRIETYGGLAATVAMTRFQVRAVSGDPNGWYHMLQPAWSLDGMWIRQTLVHWRRFFLPHEVPVSMIEPARVVQRSSLGSGWNWQADHSVRGQPLRSSGPTGRTFGWGLGMQAYCEWEVPLGEFVTALRTKLGLDESVGRGGCARGLVYFNKVEGQPAWQSKPVVGSAEVVDSGALPIAGPAGGQKSLILIADPAHVQRPRGADPLDIRDMLNWLEPQFDLDLAKLKVEIEKRVPQLLPALEGWKLALAAGAKLVTLARWDAADRYLALSVCRYEGVPASKVEVHVNGKPLSAFEVPERKLGQLPVPLLLDLKKYPSQQITLQLVHVPANEKSTIDIRVGMSGTIQTSNPATKK